MDNRKEYVFMVYHREKQIKKSIKHLVRKIGYLQNTPQNLNSEWVKGNFKCVLISTSLLSVDICKW